MSYLMHTCKFSFLSISLRHISTHTHTLSHTLSLSYTHTHSLTHTLTLLYTHTLSDFSPFLIP